MKKLTFNKLAFKSIKAGKKKYLTLALSVFFAVLFLVGGMFFIACMNASTEEIANIVTGEQNEVLLNAEGVDFDNPAYDRYFDGEVGFMSVLSFDFLPEDEKMTNGFAVAKLDERGQKLYHQKVLQGRIPEKEGEIAIESTALLRMKLEPKIGDKITFGEKAANREKFMDKTTERTYTLVGILKDRKPYMEQELNSNDRSKQFSDMLPSAFVHSSQSVAAGGKEFLIALYKSDTRYYAGFYSELEGKNVARLDTGIGTVHAVSNGMISIESKVKMGVTLCFVLAFMSCFAIANTFATNLKDRKKLIGMLRAIGATKRQTVSLFLKEAVILCAVLLPPAVLISYFGVKLFSVIMGESFVFVPDWHAWLALIVGIVLSVLCVVLSAIIPLIGISRLSPMQAVRDIELMRKVKNKKIKSQKSFRTSSLLAKRAIAFSKARFVSITLILTAAIVIVCSCVTYSIVLSKKESWMHSDYVVLDNERSGIADFTNEPIGKYGITQQKFQQCQSLPYVERVRGGENVSANLLIDGEESDYLKLVDLGSGRGRKYAADDLFYMGNIPEVTEDNFDETMHGEINPQYTEIKNKAGYNKEFFTMTLSGNLKETLEEYEEDVTDGKIDVDKINSGEEIIVNAPDEIAYHFKKSDERSYSFGVINLSVDDTELDYDELQSKKHIVKKAKNCFKVGDSITLSILTEENGKLTRKDKSYRIGAIIDDKNYYPNVYFITTVDHLNTFGRDFGYDGLSIYLDRKCDAQIDEEMQNSLNAIFPGNRIESNFVSNESRMASYRSIYLSLFSIVAVFLCVCITLINNTVTAQIGENKRTIGTLRAVGADKKELSRSYLLQILQSVGIGFVSGGVLYTIGYTVLKVVFYKNEPVTFALWAAVPTVLITLAVCLINLKIRVKSVSKYSIVENIREL